MLMNLRQNLPLKTPQNSLPLPPLVIPQLLLFVELLNLMDMVLQIYFLSIGQLRHL